MRFVKILAAIVLTTGLVFPAQATEKMKVAVLVKSLGNGFFDAVRQGAEEAAGALGDVEIIFTGPLKPTAEGQIQIMNSLIAKEVQAIVISTNNAHTLVPSTKKAMAYGIKVLSFDSAVSKEGRHFHLEPSSKAFVGETLVKMAADAAANNGEIALLLSTAQAANQNAWIMEVKKTLDKPEYAGLKVVSVVYGDDRAEKSYREARRLLKSYPNLKVIVAPTTVGIVAAAKAVRNAGLIGKVFVTGLGLPSEMAPYVRGGVVKSFAIWNPIDLGYAITYAAHEFVKGTAGETVSLGRMGVAIPDANGEAPMAEPFVFNASNIEEFATVF